MEQRRIEIGTLAAGPLAAGLSGPLVPFAPGRDAGCCRFGAEMAGLAGAFRVQMEARPGLVLHIASAESGAGVSTVALELADAAAGMPWRRVLLLRLDAGPGQENAGPGAPGARFDAAALPAALSAADLDALPSLCGRLRAAYHLIVVDCPPVGRQPRFLRAANGPAEVVLVLRAGRTRAPDAAQAMRQVAQRGGCVRGVVLNAARRSGLFR